MPVTRGGEPRESVTSVSATGLPAARPPATVVPPILS
jgi:hypothetical protein